MKEKKSSKSANRYTAAPVAVKPAAAAIANKPSAKIGSTSNSAPVIVEIKEKATMEAVAAKAVSTQPASVAAVAPKADAPKAEAPKADASKVAATAAAMPIATPAPISAEVSELVTALSHDDADVARDAATSLGELGNASAVGPLIQVLHNNDGFFHGVVRAAAAASLGKIGDSRAVEALIIAVRDPLAEPSSEAIRALGMIGDRAAIGTLLDVVRNPNGFFLGSARLAAVLALGGFRDDSASALLRAVASDPTEEPAIRQAALSHT